MRFQHTLVDFADLDSMSQDTEESEAFKAKFKPKKTTDDVYTPPAVYDAVARWVFEKYGLPEDTLVVCPFYPGGDFATHDYPEGCLVLDNPPFSLMSKIVRFYVANKVRFFLFANTLTLFRQIDLCNAVVAGGDVTFDNGAKINTSFLTSLGENRIEVAGDLHDILRDVDRCRPKKSKSLYVYPPNVTTAPRLAMISCAGLSLSIREAWPLGRLEPGYDIYGGGALMADADAQREQAQREGIMLALAPEDARRLDRLNAGRKGGAMVYKGDVLDALTDRWQTTVQVAAKVERTTPRLRSHEAQVWQALARLQAEGLAERCSCGGSAMWRRVRWARWRTSAGCARGAGSATTTQ